MGQGGGAARAGAALRQYAAADSAVGIVVPGQEPGTDPKPGNVENLGLSPSGGGAGGVAFIRTFPCTGCGAKLTYRPGTRDLKCEFCGTVNHIAENDERIEELDFVAYVHELET